jgi:hypothetical protein
MPDQPTRVNAGLRKAIELMTAWSESGDGDASLATRIAAQDLLGPDADQAFVGAARRPSLA